MVLAKEKDLKDVDQFTYVHWNFACMKIYMYAWHKHDRRAALIAYARYSHV